MKTLTLFIPLILCACATTQKTACERPPLLIPEAALHGCVIAPEVRAHLHDGARASAAEKDAAAAYQSLKSCSDDYQSLVNHVRAEKQKQTEAQ